MTFYWQLCERAIPTSTIAGCYPMFIRQHERHSYYRDVHYYVIICPFHCLLIGYDASQRDEKINTFFFRRSRIEVKSQSNHNFDNYVAVKSKPNRNCNSRFTGLSSLLQFHLVEKTDLRYSSVSWCISKLFAAYRIIYMAD